MIRAYFKSIPFDVESSEETLGFYSKTFEPLSGEPWTRILARKPKEYPINGFFVGFDAGLRKDLFLNVCVDGLPGKLIHPSLGLKDVYCTEISLSENSESRNLIRFKATFKDAPKTSTGHSSIDKTLSFLQEKKNYLTSQAVLFSQTFSAINEGFFVFSEALSMVSKANQFLRSESGFGLFTELPGRAATSISAVEEELTQLIKYPENLGRSLIQGVSHLQKTETLSFVENLLHSLAQSPVHARNKEAMISLVFAASIQNLDPKNIFILSSSVIPFMSGLNLENTYRMRTLASQATKQKKALKSFFPRPSILVAFEHYSDPELAGEVTKQTKRVFDVENVGVN